MSVPPAILSLLRSPFAYHRAFVEVAGDVAGAVYLSWLLGQFEGTYLDGGIHLAVADCYQDTGLTRHQQARVRQVLRSKGVLLEHSTSFPKRTILSLDRDRLVELLAAVWDGREEIARRALHEEPEASEPETGEQRAGNRRTGEPETGSLLARARGEESSVSLPVQVQEQRQDKDKTPPPIGPPSRARRKVVRVLYQPDDTGGGAPIPAALQRPEFLATWREWCAERAEKGDPLTVRAAQLQLRKLLSIASRRGVAVAVATIERSIECNWTGLFEPDESAIRGASQPQGQRVPDADATALEVARRRLFALAFEARQRGEIDDAYVSQVQAATKSNATMAELDVLGQKIRGW